MKQSDTVVTGTVSRLLRSGIFVYIYITSSFVLEDTEKPPYFCIETCFFKTWTNIAKYGLLFHFFSLFFPCLSPYDKLVQPLGTTRLSFRLQKWYN